MKKISYPDEIGRTALTSFTSIWRNLPDDGKVTAAVLYMNNLCDAFGIPHVGFQIDGRMAGMNAEYKESDNTVHMSYDLFEANPDALTDDANDHPGMAVCMFLTHEVIHARQYYLVKQGIYESIDVSGTRYSQEEMAASDRFVWMKTNVDKIPHRVRTYTSSGGSMIQDRDPATFVYLCEPSEREAMSGSINILKEYASVWNELDEDHPVTEKEIEALSAGQMSNLIQAYKDVLKTMHVPDYDKRMQRLVENPEKEIDKACRDVADVYCGRENADPYFKGLVRMNARSFNARKKVFRLDPYLGREIEAMKQKQSKHRSVPENLEDVYEKDWRLSDGTRKDDDQMDDPS